LSAANPQFFSREYTWERYAALSIKRRRKALLSWLRAEYPTADVLLHKIREMPTVKQCHQRRELREGVDADRDPD